VPDATADDNRLPLGLATRLAGSGGPWHALRLALDSAELAGRQTILARPGLPPRRALLGAVHAAVEELYRIALLVAEEGEREAAAPDEGAGRAATPSGGPPQAALPRSPGTPSRPPPAPPGDTRPAR
jgi:hypothetical protein